MVSAETSIDMSYDRATVNQKIVISFADLIKTARRSTGLSQKAAAARWGFDIETLRSWEQGKRNPSGLYRAKLERILKKAGA